jgi:glycosyltransferase involved in cell wall biosynthesis
VRLLILSFYYPPDLSAGAFRMGALVDALRPRLLAGDHVEIVTTLPQRYRGFSPDAREIEQQGSIRIRRISVPAHRSGMADQSRSFMQFARRALALTEGESFDLVFATSSRLMTAALGASLARRAGSSLYLDIRDIFADTIGDVLAGWRSRFVLPAINQIERMTIRSAKRVNLVSPGFLPYFESRYPATEFRCFTNGIDDDFLEISQTRSGPSGARKLLLYAGNIGAGQGLDRILPELAGRLNAEWTVRVIGGGGGEQKLRDALAEAGVTNVEMRAPVRRHELIAQYMESDCLFLHLNDFDAFLKVLPSKVFEYGATGKPILAGVAGYAAKFIQDELRNAAVFRPCNAEAALGALGALVLDQTGRPDFVSKYRRDAIMQGMATDVLSVARDTVQTV